MILYKNIQFNWLTVYHFMFVFFMLLNPNVTLEYVVFFSISFPLCCWFVCVCWFYVAVNVFRFVTKLFLFLLLYFGLRGPCWNNRIHLDLFFFQIFDDNWEVRHSKKNHFLQVSTLLSCSKRVFYSFFCVSLINS